MASESMAALSGALSLASFAATVALMDVSPMIFCPITLPTLRSTVDTFPEMPICVPSVIMSSSLMSPLTFPMADLMSASMSSLLSRPLACAFILNAVPGANLPRSRLPSRIHWVTKWLSPALVIVKSCILASILVSLISGIPVIRPLMIPSKPPERDDTIMSLTVKSSTVPPNFPDLTSMTSLLSSS